MASQEPAAMAPPQPPSVEQLQQQVQRLKVQLRETAQKCAKAEEKATQGRACRSCSWHCSVLPPLLERPRGAPPGRPDHGTVSSEV
eukprot:2087059-Alexandrium_andersonii.AAC.1